MKPLSESLVLVLGLGESGLAMARWAARQGARLRVADSRQAPPGLDALAALGEVELHTGKAAFEAADALLVGVDRVLLSPGLDPRGGIVATARARAIPVWGEMGLLAEALDDLDARAGRRIVAITGTNGKTTTTTLVAELCRGAGLDAVAAGNISPAALDVLVDRQEAGLPLPAVWVLELSSFQLETPHHLNPDAAVVLNVTDDHLDRYADLAEYAATKASIFDGARVVLVNRQDPWNAARSAQPGLISFGTDPAPRAQDYGLSEDGAWLCRGREGLLPVAELQLAGRHNQANALAALALCSAIGLPDDLLVAGLRAFRGLPHRVQRVARRADGVLFYDDSKGTNVGATLAALEGLANPVVLIAGGDGKGQDFAPLGPVLARQCRAVLLIGRDGPAIAEAIRPAGVVPESCASLETAVARAADLAQAGDWVMLSPACSSLDMFRNYAERAEVFVRSALALPGVEAV